MESEVRQMSQSETRCAALRWCGRQLGEAQCRRMRGAVVSAPFPFSTNQRDMTVATLSPLGFPPASADRTTPPLSSSAEGDSMVSGTLMLTMSNMEEELIPPAIPLAHRVQGEDIAISSTCSRLFNYRGIPAAADAFKFAFNFKQPAHRVSKSYIYSFPTILARPRKKARRQFQSRGELKCVSFVNHTV
jgi:hypothetical protein